MPTIRTLVLEDENLDLLGIQEILRHIAGVQIVAACRTAMDALEQCRQLTPDLVIVDSEIVGNKNAGPQFVREVRLHLRQARILGLTQWPECVELLRRAGCDHVVHKSLLDNQEAAERHLREVLLSRRKLSNEPETPPSLTSMEDRILRFIVLGLTEEEIAGKLQFTRRQVRGIKERLFDKFGADKDTVLVARAYQSGYLKPTDDLEDKQ